MDNVWILPAFLRGNQHVVPLYISVTYTTVSPKISGLVAAQTHDTHSDNARQVGFYFTPHLKIKKDSRRSL